MIYDLRFTIYALISLSFSLAHAFGQGALTPPGAPAPTMKSLAQIEPRTPISSAPFIITSSGSYYLTTNVSVSSGNAITISANNVTLDLNGFTISSTAPSPAGTAVLLQDVRTNITILNGFISSGITNDNTGVFSGSGFVDGIMFSSYAPVNARVSNVSVSGCLDECINVGDGSSVAEFCTAAEGGFAGVRAASVVNSTAVNCGNYGIYADVASNCHGSTLGSGVGVYAYSAAYNCSGLNSGSGYGVYATYIAIGCFGNGYIGVRAYIANSCYGTTESITYKYNMP